MDEDFEIILKAKYKLPKSEEITTLADSTNSYSLYEITKLNGGPNGISGFENGGCFCYWQRNHLFFIFGPAPKLKGVKASLTLEELPATGQAFPGFQMISEGSIAKNHSYYTNSYSAALKITPAEVELEDAVLELTARFDRSSEMVLVPRAQFEESAALDHGLVHSLEEPQLSDVTFVVNGTKIPAHKSILAARCEYFSRMFASGMEECHSNEIQVQDCTAGQFNWFLKVLYGGFGIYPTIRLADVVGIFRLTEKYQITDLSRSGLKLIRSKTHEKNVQMMLKAACELDHEELRKISFEVLKGMEEKGRWRILTDLGDEDLVEQFLASL